MRQRRPVIIALAAGLICLLVYLRALSCGFLNFDDHDFVVNNLPLRSFDWNLIKWAFTTVIPISGSWIPLSWLSFALDYQIWGLDPFGFHLTNILLHAVNTVLVVLITDRICRDRLPEFGIPSDSAYLYPLLLLLSGLFFAIHPLRVESVVWVTERRGVLNGVFYLLALLFYLRYVDRVPGSGTAWYRSGNYYLSLLFMLVSFMAKPSSVVIPALLLVLDWYPLNRLRKETLAPVLAEKLPFFFFAGVMAVASVYLGAQGGALQAGAAGLSFWQKTVLSGNAIFEYCRLTLYPVGIIPVRIILNPIPATYALKAACVAAATIAAGFAWQRRWVPALWLLFLIPILPVLTFFQMNSVEYAARYTYLPSVATAIAGAVILTRAGCRLAALRSKLLFSALTLGLILFYAGMTQRLTAVWQNSGTMWTRVIQFQPFDRAFFLRGLYYVDAGNFLAAVQDYTTCLKIAGQERLPQEYVMNIHAFRGEAFFKWGRYEESVQDLTAAIAIKPHPLYFYHRGTTLRAMGLEREAEADFIRAGRAQGQMAWINI
ncbi:transmembrane and TPR repeat-containing protein [Geobacter sp. OR-1]|uniref:tetratricopeptide repeat protein n=1 Tax=Geobacter sp. OR-1 TaxID=1266765 RepID=UPI00054288E9|nr:hypothetical protein [Geobacter sp. OR-1]GAM10565.1 transmembrane and TPR repeat-containing protein [Geobacter sp. OR-1]